MHRYAKALSYLILFYVLPLMLAPAAMLDRASSY